MKVNYSLLDKPNYLVVSNYVGEIYIWGYDSFDKSERTKSDIGVWKIKYK